LPSPGARSIAVTFVTLGLAYGVWYAYSVFLVALLQEFGWSRSLVAGAFSVFVLVHGLLSAPLGWLADRLGPRRLILAGGLLLAGALVLDGAVTRPWHLYVAFGILTSMGVAAAGWIPGVVLVQRWFPGHVGTALGVTSAGIGVGIFVVVPACQWLIEAAGWRWAFRTLGIAVAAWVVPATLLLLRDPGPLALAAPASARDAAGAPGDHVTLRGALVTRTFWLLGLTQVGGSFATQMLLAHQVAYLVDQGIAALMAASVVGVVGLASVVSKAGGGWFSDRFGRELTYTLGMGAVVASIATLGVVAIAPGPVPAYAYGVLVGAGYAVTAPLMPAVANDFFRGRHFGAIFGTLHIANAVGGSLGPWVAGWIFDTTRTYAPAFGTAAGAAALATLALWIAAPRRAVPPARRTGWREEAR
jgi:MFS family permease